MKRVPLRRTVALVNHAKRDPVTPALRSTVLLRDGECLMHRFNPMHVCRDAWGRPHAAWALDALSIEHVKDQLAMGRRAPSDASHCVALCYGANDAVPSKEARAFFRAYLSGVSPPTGPPSGRP